MRTMPKFPKVDKFRGDNQQSFSQWILMFEAQLTVLEIENDKKRETLLCLLDSNAFTRAAQYIAATPTANYAQLKAELIRLFSGEDYRRSLETKMRTLVFTIESNIPVFCNDLRIVVSELFGVTDEATVEKIAINDVVGKLDPSVQEHLKVLQLTGNCKLETFLELAKSKMGEHSITNTFLSSAAMGYTAPSSSSNNVSLFTNRMDRLEKMVEGLASNIASTSISRGPCGECRGNHETSRCFKFKTCFFCHQKGHIAQFCPKKIPSAAVRYDPSTRSMPISKGRIMIDLRVQDNKVTFLNDTGSDFTMMTLKDFNELSNKPALTATNKIGFGVQNVPFKIDGIFYAAITFIDVSGGVYLLRDEPILVSSAIDSNLLGNNTHERFKRVTRDNERSLMKFVTSDGKDITLQFYREKDNAPLMSSFVHVKKSTVIAPQSYSFIKEKLSNINVKSGLPYIITGVGDTNYEAPDLLMENVNLQEADEADAVKVSNSERINKIEKKDEIGESSSIILEKLIDIKGNDNIIADIVSRDVKSTPIYDVINCNDIEFHSLMEDNDDLIVNKQNALQTFTHLPNSNAESFRKNPNLFRKHISNISLNDDGFLVYNFHCDEQLIASVGIRKDILELSRCSYLFGHHGVLKTHQVFYEGFDGPHYI